VSVINLLSLKDEIKLKDTAKIKSYFQSKLANFFESIPQRIIFWDFTIFILPKYKGYNNSGIGYSSLIKKLLVNDIAIPKKREVQNYLVLGDRE